MEYEGNIFYDNVKDIINLNDYSYINSGVVRAIGLENTLSYNHKNWNVRGTLYMHTVIDADDLYANPQILEIENKLRRFSQNDLNAILSVVNAINEKY